MAYSPSPGRKRVAERGEAPLLHILKITYSTALAILDSTILLVLLVFVQADIDNSNSIMLNRRPANSNPKDIIKLGIILVPVACFAVGLFPIHPKAIATASMYPEIEIGDVVIVKKCTINDIKEGDVIEYQIEKQNIVHRVERIENENGILKIITNNKARRSACHKAGFTCRKIKRSTNILFVLLFHTVGR